MASWKFGIAVLAVLVLLGGCGQAAGTITPTVAPKTTTAAPTAASVPTKAPAAAPAVPPTVSNGKPTGAPTDVPKPTSTAPVAAKVTPEVTVKYGDLTIVSDAGVYIGIEKGYFKEQGINVELTSFNSAAQMMPALATEKLDAGGGAASAALFNAIMRDIPLKLVADKGSSYAGGFTSQSIVVRKELIEQGKVKDYSDLKGLKIANVAPANSSEITLYRAFEKGKVSPADVKIEVMGFPEMITALSNGSVDAASLVEPFVTVSEQRGVALRWKSAYEIYPNQVVGTLAFAPSLIKKGADLGNRFIVAYIKGVRDYNDAFGPKKKNLSEIVSVLVKYTTTKDAQLIERSSPSGLNPDGYINLEGMESDLDWYIARGYMKEKPKVSDIVDHRYVDYALGVLGKYRP